MESSRQDFDDVRSKLLNAITVCDTRYKQGVEMEKRADHINSQIDMYERSRGLVVSTINHIIELVKLTEVYLEVKERESKQSLQAAISKSSEMVPGASSRGATLMIEDKKAWIKTALTNDVSEQEGSGYRSVLSILLRYAFIHAKPNTLKFIIIDEGLGPLSDETVDNFKQYLSAFKEDTLVIGIEQRSYTYDGIADMVYGFNKKDGVTKVKRIS